MDEQSSNSSVIDIKGLTKFKAFADRLSARNIISDEKLSRLARVSVEGYDTSFREVEIKQALIKHFSSCGTIWDVVIPNDLVCPRVLDRIGFIYFLEEGAQEKVVALNRSFVAHIRSDKGGWNVVVEALPKKVCEFSHDQLESARRLLSTRQDGFTVTGFDISLSEDDLRSVLFGHFSSCGEIIYLTVQKDPCQHSQKDTVNPVFSENGYTFICISGEGALDKALALSGSDFGGWNVDVESLMIPLPNQSIAILSTGSPSSSGYPQAEYTVAQ